MIKFIPETVAVSADNGNRGSVHFSTEDARFHIWVQLDPFAPTSALYKNPPLDVDRYTASRDRNPAHFDTRKLDPEAAANRATIERVFEIVRERGLVAKAIERRAEADRVKEERSLARQRIAHVRELGPQLLDVLRSISDHIETKRAALPDFAAEGRRLRDEALAIIATADAPLDQRVEVKVRPKARPDQSPTSVYAANERAGVEKYLVDYTTANLDLIPDEVEVVSVRRLDD